MSLFPLKPTHAPVKAYYAALAKFQLHDHTTEGNTRSAFADLLKRCASPYGWHLVEEYQFKGTAKQPLRADGALVDDLLVHGLWEAKDSADDLHKEIKAKFAKGYPLTNILFQSPTHAVLYQGSRKPFDGPIDKPEALLEVLQLFFEHREEHEVDWEEAVTKFADKIPDLARGVTTILEGEDKQNSTFRENFRSFATLCRQSINPDLTDDAIRKMLVQHLLTERIFRKVFNNQEFLQRNVIAVEIEKVIRSITSRHFSRDAFLKNLDHFYTAIEKAAKSQQGYTEKQHFLNAVYEKFFQSFDTKQADTHGIVYTPQPIVDFMVRSVEEILHQEFGKSLSDSDVHILDPFTGTGNFVTRIMQEIKRSALPHKYAHELHCNEIMLLPYYIASMNIEHAYSDAVGGYRSFDGICLVDTFSTLGQLSVFATENTVRIFKQMESPIKVVIGNPPYNAGQTKENDQAKNSTYNGLNSIDDRVRKTYTKDSKATLRNKHGDPYIKAFRWATDRIGESGVVCYISNNSFIDKGAFDGMRKHLAQDFSQILIVDLGGDVKANPRLSGTTHNVFGIQLGVSITFLVRHVGKDRNANAQIKYVRMPETWRKQQKYDQLALWGGLNVIEWTSIQPGAAHTWLNHSDREDFQSLLPLVDKTGEPGLFERHTLGISTNRDSTVYGFNELSVSSKVKGFISKYQTELNRVKAEESIQDLDVFLDYDGIQWSRNLKRHLANLDSIKFDKLALKETIYRPFAKRTLYEADVAVDEPSKTARWAEVEENRFICVPTVGGRSHPWVFSASLPINLNLVSIDATQCFPYFTCGEGSEDIRENIPQRALVDFRNHYADDTITKWQIFHATYAVLHHPQYRTRYAANLKRGLPRIPFPPDFRAFTAAGKRLMNLHIDYEKQPEYKLEQIEDPKAEVSFLVDRMRLNKEKSELRYNDFLLLRRIPPTTFDYRLGNRSALEWVIDQYRISVDDRSGIRNDPNREDDPKYILRLIGQVITVSLETQQIIAALPSLNFEPVNAPN